jgi:hypothetical protein
LSLDELADSLGSHLGFILLQICSSKIRDFNVKNASFILTKGGNIKAEPK